MNKSTKIWLNYLLGIALSLLLLWGIYRQVMTAGIDLETWWQTGPDINLYLCLGLLFVNIVLESSKWYLLTNYVEPVGYFRALGSYLAGMAVSIVTPNRVGDYPGRILYLGRGNTFRYINVSVLGAVSQLSAIFLFGLAGLIYYNIVFRGLLAQVALGLCIAANICVTIIYWRFENWFPGWGDIKLFRRFVIYGRLLNRVTTKRQVLVLLLSVMRFGVFTAQYLFLLRWMNIDIPLAEGFIMSALFFWTMAVVPTIALTELGVRGNVSLYLFHNFSANSLGILSATTGIWLLNLILPSILGSILIMRMRLLR